MGVFICWGELIVPLLRAFEVGNSRVGKLKMKIVGFNVPVLKHRLE